MTISDLVVATGLSKMTIYSLENEHDTPSLPTLRRLSETLGVPIAYLGCFENLPESTLGERIKKARLYHGMTKREFAKKLGVDVRTSRSWEYDQHKPMARYFTQLEIYLQVLD